MFGGSRRSSGSAAGAQKVAPGTRSVRYRCSLPGLAGFTAFASPRTISPQKNEAEFFSARTPKIPRLPRLPPRRGRDSNPRYLAAHTISSRAPSASRSPSPKCAFLFRDAQAWVHPRRSTPDPLRPVLKRPTCGARGGQRPRRASSWRKERGIRTPGTPCRYVWGFRIRCIQPGSCHLSRCFT